jgi:hypothetical protein
MIITSPEGKYDALFYMPEADDLSEIEKLKSVWANYITHCESLNLDNTITYGATPIKGIMGHHCFNPILGYDGITYNDEGLTLEGMRTDLGEIFCDYATLNWNNNPQGLIECQNPRLASKEIVGVLGVQIIAGNFIDGLSLDFRQKNTITLNNIDYSISNTGAITGKYQICLGRSGITYPGEIFVTKIFTGADRGKIQAVYNIPNNCMGMIDKNGNLHTLMVNLICTAETNSKLSTSPIKYDFTIAPYGLVPSAIG